MTPRDYGKPDEIALHDALKAKGRESREQAARIVRRWRKRMERAHPMTGHQGDE